MLDRRNEVLVRRHEDSYAIGPFPSKSDKICNYACINGLLCGTPESRSAGRARRGRRSAGAAVDRMRPPMTLRCEYAEARLPVQEVVEPGLEVSLPSRLIPCIDARLLKSERAKTRLGEEGTCLSDEHSGKKLPITEDAVRPLVPCQLEIPVIDKNACVHCYVAEKKYGEPKLPGANIRIGVRTDAGQTWLNHSRRPRRRQGRSKVRNC